MSTNSDVNKQLYEDTIQAGIKWAIIYLSANKVLPRETSVDTMIASVQEYRRASIQEYRKEAA